MWYRNLLLLQQWMSAICDNHRRVLYLLAGHCINAQGYKPSRSKLGQMLTNIKFA